MFFKGLRVTTGLKNGFILAITATTVMWPVMTAWSAPAADPAVINVGLLSVGGTAAASASSALGPAQAFDGLLYGETKASQYENGWVARNGVGAWLERVWPGRVQVTGLTITRRSNRTIGLCDKVKDVLVDVGGGQPSVITLADTNAPQYFALSSNPTRKVRLTVDSVEGENCLNGAIGFSEVEIYGRPKNWTPLTSTMSASVMPTGSVPANTIQFTFDANIPADSQLYLATVINQLFPVMTEMLGSPLASQTLMIKLNPAYGSFTYAPALSMLTISRLPNTAAAPNDPVNWDFNSNLTHELAHAYQSGYGFSAPAWFREGFAQAATELIKQVLIERGTPLLQNATIDEGQAIRTYDAMAAMGPEVMEAAWNGNSRIIPYTNATGFWWLLLLSQSSPRVENTFAELDWFRRVQAGLYQFPTNYSYAAYRNLLASLSPNQIDGRPAGQWIMRQPIVQTASYQNAFGFYPAGCVCSQSVAAEAQHLIMFWRGAFGNTGSLPVTISLRDADGQVVSEETVTYVDYGFGFFYYTWPVLIDRLPAGRYDIVAEATINGTLLRATSSIARGSYSLAASDGLSLTRRLASPTDPLSISPPSGTYVPTSTTSGRVVDVGASPHDLALSVNGRPSLEYVFWPAPYTRYINLP